MAVKKRSEFLWSNGPIFSAITGTSTANYIRKDCKCLKYSIKTVNSLTEQFSKLFADKLGTVTSYKSKVHVRPEAAPRFYERGPVPFAIRALHREALDLLAEQGIIEKVSHNDGQH